MGYDLDLDYWTKQYETDYHIDVGGRYPKYIDEKGVENTEKSPYFEAISKVITTRGYLLKKEFVSICNWKSHRQINNYIRNDEETVRRITKQVLTQENDVEKIKLLACGELSGVQLPVASSILTVIFPDTFCITDYRAWRALMWWKQADATGHMTFDNYSMYCDYLDSLETNARKWFPEPKVPIWVKPLFLAVVETLSGLALAMCPRSSQCAASSGQPNPRSISHCTSSTTNLSKSLGLL